MNHSRTNPPVRNCPNCGELLNTQSRGSCNEIKHAARRKDRQEYCSDCGKRLRGT